MLYRLIKYTEFYDDDGQIIAGHSEILNTFDDVIEAFKAKYRERNSADPYSSILFGLRDIQGNIPSIRKLYDKYNKKRDDITLAKINVWFKSTFLNIGSANASSNL